VALKETTIHQPLFPITPPHLVYKAKVQVFWDVYGMLTGNCSPAKMIHHLLRLESS